MGSILCNPSPNPPSKAPSSISNFVPSQEFVFQLNPLSSEDAQSNQEAFNQFKFSSSLPEFNRKVLEGYGQCDDLIDDVERALEDLANSEISYWMNYRIDTFDDGIVFEDEFFDEGLVFPMQSEGAEMADSTTTEIIDEDSFGTNNQQEGVDEADQVKSDGNFVYTIYGNKIVVLDILGNVLDRLELATDSMYYSNYGIKALLLNQNKLVAFLSHYWISETEIIIMDIDPESGKLTISERKMVNGIYQAARMVDSSAHFITSSYLSHWNILDVVSRFQNSYGNLTDAEYAELAFEKVAEVIPRYAEGLVIDLLNVDDSIDAATCSNIAKLSSYKNGLSDENDWTGHNVLGGFVQITSFDIASGLNVSMNVSGTFTPNGSPDVYATSDMIFLGGRGWAASSSNTSAADVTYITAFELSNASASLNATGIIPGYTLNQFSFDYYDGHLRVATTTDSIRTFNLTTFAIDIAQNSSSQVLVTKIEDDEIKIVGELGGLGETERIFAMRFVNDLAFMVTFRQTDPFYTIDLSVPENPIMRGELKIPGFSNYLHPIDDDYIIAVGQDTDENGFPLGLQVALFNVSDLDVPQQIAKHVVDGWSSSQSQNDHQAFRYLPESKKLILPVSQSGSFDGFYVYDIDPTFDASVEEGISLDFKISHNDFELENCFWRDYLNARSLVFGGDLMTLKGHSILSHDLATEEKIFEIELDEEDSNVFGC